MKEIVVTFKKDGSTTVATKGFQGAACLKETARLEAKLGRRTSDEPTPEMNQKEGEREQRR